MRYVSLAAALALTLGAPAAHANLIANGNFGTGDFSDWTLTTTPGGTLGLPPLPQVTSFDVTGMGATNAAQFQVGAIGPGSLAAGGSISQMIVTSAGTLVFSAAIAAQSFGNNAQGGLFQVLLDGTIVDTVAINAINVDQVIRSSLSFTDVVDAGSHDLEISITREFGTGGGTGTPFEFVTNIDASVPEPSSLALLGSALIGFVFFGFRGLQRDRQLWWSEHLLRRRSE